MRLNDFVIQEARPLPVFLLIDTSGSMTGIKINAVNAALRELISSLQNIDDIRGQIQVSIVTFGREVSLLTPLENVEKVELTELGAAGRTPMAETIHKVIEMIEDKEVVPSRAYTPTIILVSDGHPTDITPDEPIFNKIIEEEATTGDYLEWSPIRSLHSSPRTKKCVKLALGIGEDLDYSMLKAFIHDDKIPVIKANEATGISRFFQWVSMSISARSVSKNPEEFDGIPFDDFFSDDELVK
jgi:uncharacterized protein YegL